MTKADIVRQVSENTGIDKKEVGAVKNPLWKMFGNRYVKMRTYI